LATGEPGQVAPPCFADPNRASCFGRTRRRVHPGRPPAQAGHGRSTGSLAPTPPHQAPSGVDGGRPGRSPDNNGQQDPPSGRPRTVGRSATGSPCRRDEAKPLDVVPGAGPRAGTPSGAGTGRVGGIERQRGNPPGTVPATKVAGQGSTNPQPRWLASRGGASPRGKPATQGTTAERTDPGPRAKHGGGAPTPQPVEIPMASSPRLQAFKGRSPREHRAVVRWQHQAGATDSSADESLEVGRPGKAVRVDT